MPMYYSGFSKTELKELPTIEQAWDGDELKFNDGEMRIWLTHRENRQYNGDYTIEKRIDGKWSQESGYFQD